MFLVKVNIFGEIIFFRKVCEEKYGKQKFLKKKNLEYSTKFTATVSNEARHETT